MKYYIFILTFMVSALAIAQSAPQRPSCQDPTFDSKVSETIQFSVPVVSCEEVNDWKKKGTSFILFDAREKEEYDISHIPGAVYIGYDDFEIGKMEVLNKDETIVVYCSIGYRSEKIGERLKDKGFTTVYNLYGSIFEWGNLGFPLEDQFGESTKNIHTYNARWARWVMNDELKKIH